MSTEQDVFRESIFLSEEKKIPGLKGPLMPFIQKHWLFLSVWKEYAFHIPA